MKTCLSLFFVIAALVAPAAADTCVRIESHTDEYYYMGQTHPAEDRIDQIWFGGDKVAYITGNQKMVFDTGDSSFVFVNLADSSYAETKLPFDWANLVSTDTYAFLEKYQRHGEAKETAATKTIGSWACREYEITSWLNVEDGRYNEREETAWMSVELPIDWDLFHRIHRDFLVLSNYDDAFIAELLKIDGFSAATETRTYIQGFSVNSRERVVDVSEKTAPPDLYAAPDGFRKKSELTLEDING
jgi:hypothetical protein